MAKYTKCLNNECCFFTGQENNLERHHIFGGIANRKLSEKYGLKVWLHHEYHTGTKYGVHHNAENDLKLKQYGQQKFIEMYPDLDFLTIFGRNYL